MKYSVVEMIQCNERKS